MPWSTWKLIELQLFINLQVPCRPKKNGGHPKSQQCLAESSWKFDSSRQVFYSETNIIAASQFPEVSHSSIQQALPQNPEDTRSIKKPSQKTCPRPHHPALHVILIGALSSMCQNSTRTFRRGLDCKGLEHLRHLPGAIQGN